MKKIQIIYTIQFEEFNLLFYCIDFMCWMDWIQECTAEQIFWNKGTVPWAKTRIDQEWVVEQDPLDPGPDAFLARKGTKQTERGRSM
jgi:hypothetical protein